MEDISIGPSTSDNTIEHLTLGDIENNMKVEKQVALTYLHVPLL